MTQLISDQDLINELQLRFDKNEKLLKEQFNLMLQLRSVNEKLVASEGMKSNFLSNIRNEINNPLASILELSKNISEGTLDIDTMKRFSELIYGEAFGLDFQLRNIFASAEIEAGEAIISPVGVNLNSLIQNVISAFRHQLQKKKLLLINNTQNNEQELFRTDSEKLHLILSNLLNNAIQFSNIGDSIEISSSVINSVLTLSVIDTGRGMTREEQTIIFDRFRQCEEGSTKPHGGHGLGLSVTKAMLELVSGSISVKSEREKGSTFTIRVNESNAIEQEDTYSLEGNDFMFSGNDDMSF
jgi:signal transduction histidine kinase